MEHWKAPMLATLSREQFSSEDWLYEPKFDGVRVMAYKEGGRVMLYSRNRIVLNETYPEIVATLQRRNSDFIVDGEVVALVGTIPSFARLQGRMQIRDASLALASGIEVHYYVFDCLSKDGENITDEPLIERKKILRSQLSFGRLIRYTEHVEKAGEALLLDLCARGWEGVIAKRKQSRYVHKRSREWLKFKCQAGQEFVIGGFTKGTGSRIGFGALLLGYYEHGKLRFAGKVGTGYDDAFLREFSEKLRRAERKTNPFADPVKERNVHFVRPEYVAQVGFTEWTLAGKLRQPRFLGLRMDKAASEVTRER